MMNKNSKIELGKQLPTDFKNRSRVKQKNNTSKKSLGKTYAYIKNKFVSRLFWGRSNFYKNISHTFMILTTVLITLTGVLLRVSSLTESQTSSLLVGSNIVGTDDLLQQGGSIDTVLLSSTDNVLTVNWQEHVVKEGETLAEIEEKYKVNKQTIQSANAKEYSSLFLGEQIEAGWVLRIPDINGIVHEVRAGEDIDSIVERYASEGNTEANRFNIIEFNALTPPFELEVGQLLFIPDGNTALLNDTTEVNLDQLVGAFIDPLSHPDCSGYNFSRGFLSYHNGVDLAKGGGCPIVSVADGVVEYAGWASQGQGYMVRINHGSGIKTEYFHGNGEFYVKAGDVVDQNQPIMYMGTTGNSTGTHLHFILWYKSVAINPRPYVPYIGAY